MGLILLGLFVYYNYYFKKDNLLKYIPKEAYFYSTLKLNSRIEENPVLKRIIANLATEWNLETIDWEIFNPYVGNNFALALIPAKDKNFSTPDILLVFDLSKKKNGLEKYLQILKDKNLAYQFLINERTKKEILIASNSEKLLNNIRKIALDRGLSLGQKVNVILNLKDFSPNKFLGKIYLNLQYFSDNLDKISDPRIKILLGKMAMENLDDLYLGVKNENTQIILQNFINQYNNDNNQVNIKLPQTTKYYFKFNINKNEIFQFLDVLKKTEPEYFNKISSNINYWQKQYNFNLEADILPLMQNQVQLIGDTSNNFLVSSNIEPKNIDERINKIRGTILNYFNVSFPREIPKQLPDASSITQIIKNNYVFNEEKIDNITLYYLKNDGMELAYTIWENELILANSKNFLKMYISQDNLIPINEISACFGNNSFNFSQNLLINERAISELLGNYQFAKYLSIKSDNNDKFWLCVE